MHCTALHGSSATVYVGPLLHQLIVAEIRKLLRCRFKHGERVEKKLRKIYGKLKRELKQVYDKLKSIKIDLKKINL